MSGFLVLEDFAQPTSVYSAGMREAKTGGSHQKVYDEGYSAGWDDALKQASVDADTSQEQVAAALQELDFTYFEARRHVMSSLKPLLETILSSVLPKCADIGLAPTILEELQSVTEHHQAALTLHCSPTTQESLSAAVAAHCKTPVQVVAEETLAPSQARISWDEGHISIDFASVIDRINVAVDRFYEAPLKVEAQNA